MRIRATNTNGQGEWGYIAARPLAAAGSPAWVRASLANSSSLYANLTDSPWQAALWAASSVRLQWSPAPRADRYYIKVLVLPPLVTHELVAACTYCGSQRVVPPQLGAKCRQECDLHSAQAVRLKFFMTLARCRRSRRMVRPSSCTT